MQEVTGLPSMTTVQEPHWPSPHPNFAAFSRKIVAQDVEQRGLRIRRDFVVRAVHVQN